MAIHFADGYFFACVAQGLGLDVKQVKRLAEMYQEARAKATA